MSLTSTTMRNDYVGNGSTNLYAYGFKVFSEDDLRVIVVSSSGVETVLTKTTDYTVSGVLAAGGGHVTLVDDNQAWIDGSGFLATGYSLVVKRQPSIVQETGLRNLGSYYPENHENQFDKFVMLMQNLNDSLNRAAKVKESSTVGPVLPPAVVGKGLYYDADGNLVSTTFNLNEITPGSVQTIEETTGASDASKSIRTDTDGYLDRSFNNRPIRIMNATGTLLETDYQILITNTSGITISLPTAQDGLRYKFKRSSGNINPATIAATGGAQINGVSTFLMRAHTGSIEIFCDGTNWHVCFEADNRNIVLQSGSNQTATRDIAQYNMDTSSGGRTVTLPAVSTSRGFEYTIKKITSDFNPLTVDGNASETINGFTSINLMTEGESVTVFCDGGSWHIRDHYIPKKVFSFTPAWTGVTVGNGTNTGKMWRNGKFLEGSVTFILGSTSAITGIPQMTLPNSWTVDSNYMPLGNFTGVGQGVLNDTGTTAYPVFTWVQAASALAISFFNTSGTSVGTIASTVPFTWTTNDQFTFNFKIPITQFAE